MRLALGMALLPGLGTGLLLGALLRVLAELLGDYGAVSGPLMALGGLISFCGFALFAFGLWSSLLRLPNKNA